MPPLVRDRGVPRRVNLDAALTYAWSAGAFTSTEAMSALGLARSTTIEAIDDLVSLGFLRELPNARAAGEYRNGRPSRRFELAADSAVVVGVDAGRAHLVTTVANLRGERLVALTNALDVEADSAAERRTLIAAAVDAALVRAGKDRDDVLSICVGVPAPVDREGRSPAHRENFWARMNPELLELFAWVPIARVANDASLASVAEHAHGAAVGLHDTVTLLAGDRFGAGVVVDGNRLHGAHGGVAETLVLRNLEGVGEAYGIGYQIGAWARARVAAGDLPAGHALRQLPAEAVTAPVVLELASQGDAESVAIAERAGMVLSRIAGVFGSLYDPERIIIAGAVADGIEEVLEVARSRLPGELDLPAPELVASALGADVVSVGAVAAALEAARDGALHIGGPTSEARH